MSITSKNVWVLKAVFPMKYRYTAGEYSVSGGGVGGYD